MTTTVEFGTPNNQRQVFSAGTSYSFKFKAFPYLNEGRSLTKQELSSEQNNVMSLTEVVSSRTAFVNGYDPDRVDVPDLSNRNVVIELISAKLSYPPQSNNPSPHASPSPTLSGMSSDRRSTISASPVSQIPSTPSLRTQGRTSKRYVSYSILVKLTPGLDRHPSVVERRFSDFLNLFQALRYEPSLARILDYSNINFPKKIIVGNFSANNIAERSVEFERLLHLCVSETKIRHSTAFVSFLFEKELREAQRLYVNNEFCEAQYFQARLNVHEVSGIMKRINDNVQAHQFTRYY
ncbi:Sorting nexin-20 [Fragariocoptes setiger]|uniref:Sorting nexin-20 n=1 Tax=Fragariocoptes setiger TaxID=1670756 RepID=A0ABQ7SB91_9ACAR|nr:Sorting nexin-20 [Fragariocoptes setiger]